VPGPPATRRRTVGYVLYAYPQLSETFIDNELRVLAEHGVPVVAWSLLRPPPHLVGPASLGADRLAYLPRHIVLAAHYAWWLLRSPRRTIENVLRAVSHRSLTMLKGAYWAAFVASGLRRSGARHVHAHFAYEPACTALPAAHLARLPFTFTAHARDIYLRNRGLDARARLAARVVTVCEYNAQQLLDRCPSLTRPDIDIVYCGVDVERFVPRAGGPAGTRVLSVGRLVEKKGFNELIHAVALLRKQQVQVTCDIVGDGPQREELAETISRLGVADVITLAGSVGPEELARRMPDYDVFALACRIDEAGDRDSMPVVLKEAMSCGLPVVATAVAGIPELVDEEVGVLVPPDDVEALADALRHVLSASTDHRATLGARGRRRVVERFNVRTETMRLAAIFDGLSGTQGPEQNA
jgi:colanic acid/amylovoran biosynthesis glycosyltransferase